MFNHQQTTWCMAPWVAGCSSSCQPPFLTLAWSLTRMDMVRLRLTTLRSLLTLSRGWVFSQVEIYRSVRPCVSGPGGTGYWKTQETKTLEQRDRQDSDGGQAVDALESNKTETLAITKPYHLLQPIDQPFKDWLIKMRPYTVTP